MSDTGYPSGGWHRQVSKAPVHCWFCDSDYIGDGTETCMLCGWQGFLTAQGEELHPQKRMQLDELRRSQA